jgi:predicted enzyme related to lactoylglutathione lyase
MAAKSKSTRTKKSKTPSGIVWFEVPADDLSRAKRFYKGLFGWKINAFPKMKDYLHIDTGGADASPDGGLMKRMCPEHQGITSYVSVESVEKFAARVEKLGGKICKPKTAVPEMGYFAICQDTENNVFAIWERNDKAEG